jgi:hypothetical protein
MMKKHWFKHGITAMVILVFGLLALDSCASGPSAVKTAPGDMQNSYFVSANGNDKSDGRSEPAAFKTLAKAVQAATTSSIRAITVIGTVSGETSEILNGGPSEILITGKPNAVAVLSVSEGHVINISGSNVRFEHIVLTGGNTGGLYLEEKSTVTLGSGTLIKGNDGYYGGLIINTDCTITMEDNAEISGNTAVEGAGGAIWGTLIMKDNAIIKDNAVNTQKNDEGKIEGGNGGGLYIEDGTLMMQDNALISDNEAYYGGGLFNWDGTVTLQGNAKIKGNELFRSTTNEYGGSGGGVYTMGDQGVITLTGSAAISENKAGFGAGAYVSDKATLILQDSATITNNTIVYWTDSDDTEFGGNGGGIYGNQGTITIQNKATCLENKASYGAGMYISGGTLTLQDTAAINGNAATGNGGGVLVTGGSTFTMKGNSIISDNTAGPAGGGVWVDSTFTLAGGSISNNTATVGGGGIFIGKGAQFTQQTGSISGNTAPENANIDRATD